MSKRADIIEKRTQKHRDAAARASDGFVRTPAVLAEEITTGHPEIGALSRGSWVLEPSAGDGALVRAILDADSDAHVIAVEPNNTRADALDALAAEHPGRVTVVRATFEDYAAVTARGPFDAVIMNPPFGDSTRAVVWIDHIRTAWELLHPGAQLVTVVPGSYEFRADRAHREFREWATAQGARFAKLPGQPFAQSGTGTSAGVLTIPRPMPARPDGLPSWLLLPAAGAPVRVPGYPQVGAADALARPVQEYDDRSDGSRPRVIRYAGTCYGCARPVWVHDDRGDAATWEASSIDAADYGHAGPAVALCLDCYHGNADAHTAALRDVRAYWTDAPADADTGEGPNVYPGDLGAGIWATVRGIDSRGWTFTLTGRVMCDPERVADLGEAASFRDERIAVTLRTARGVDVELYALEDSRVIVRDVPGDVVPEPCGEPIPYGLPQPAAGRPLATPQSAARLAEAADMAAHHRAAADNARAHLDEWQAPAGGSTVVARTSYGAPVIVAHVSRVDLTAPAQPEPVAQVEPESADDAAPFVSGWGQLALPV